MGKSVTGNKTMWGTAGRILNPTGGALGVGLAGVGAYRGHESDAMHRDMLEMQGKKDANKWTRNAGKIGGGVGGFVGTAAGAAGAKALGFDGFVGRHLIGNSMKIGGGLIGGQLGTDVGNKLRNKHAKIVKQSDMENRYYSNGAWDATKDFVKGHKNQLIGAGVGTVAGGIGGHMLDRHQKREGNWLKRNAGAVGGAVLGAGAGYGGVEAYNKWGKKKNVNVDPYFADRSAQLGDAEGPVIPTQSINPVGVKKQASLKGVWNTSKDWVMAHPKTVGGIAGAGLGAGVGAVATRRTKNKKKKIGAILGGAALGAGAGIGVGHYNKQIGDGIKSGYGKVKGIFKKKSPATKAQSAIDQLVDTRFYADTPAVREFCGYDY